MRHEQAWQRLPDLLEDRDEPDLLAHVRGCVDCQRQLFLLGRVDRLLRNEARARQPRRKVRRAAAAGAALAAAAVVVIALLVPRGSHVHEFALRTASGRYVIEFLRSPRGDSFCGTPAVDGSYRSSRRDYPLDRPPVWYSARAACGV